MNDKPFADSLRARGFSRLADIESVPEREDRCRCFRPDVWIKTAGMVGNQYRCAKCGCYVWGSDV